MKRTSSPAHLCCRLYRSLYRNHFASLAAGLALLLATSGATASTITVVNNLDSGAGSLRQAISDAAADDTINFDMTQVTSPITLSGHLALEKNLTITGPGPDLLAISGAQVTRCFFVDSGITAQISGLTIQDGSVQSTIGGVGGGIYNLGTLTLNNCTFSGNSADQGGGINSAGTLTLDNCTFNGNSAGFVGGGILVNGAPLGPLTLTLNNCAFSGNSAGTGSGGGIYAQASASNNVTLVLHNCTFSGNSANQGGGGIEIIGDAVDHATLTLNNCTITGNSATARSGGGGGLQINGTTANLSNCTVIGNSAVAAGGGIFLWPGSIVAINHCTISGNSGGLGGGGLSVSGRTPCTLRNSIVAGNTATTAPDVFAAAITSNGANFIGDASGITTGLQATDKTFANTGATLDTLLETSGGIPVLKDNGGPTFTVALVPNSPALDAGLDTDAAAFTTDQRGTGFTRKAGAHVDIGAFEVQLPASTLAVSGYPSPTTAGDSHTFTVTALDSYGNTVPSYVGTVHLTSSDSGAGLPADYTFTADDEGTHTFNATFNSSGTQSLSATDTANSGLTGSQSGITVVAGPATHLALNAPSSATAGNAFSVTLTALDQFNNVATGYTGTAHFTTTDSATGTGLPSDYSFTAGDNGVHTFTSGVTLVTAGLKSVTATDTGTASIKGCALVTVSAAAATHFTLSAPPSATAGNAFSVTVTALDQFNNVATGYRGTAHFFKSDSATGTALPADYSFTAGDNGVHTFSAGVRLVTAGPQSLAANDAVTTSITGSANVAVNAAAATHFTLSAPGSATAGNAFSVTLSAQDQFNNVATGYRGTAHFTKSDSTVGTALPADYSFTAGDNGVHSFSAGVTLVTAGPQSVAAADTVTTTITGNANVAVTAAAATHFTLSAPPSATAGNAFSVTLTAFDQFNNVATGYTGTAHFTKSDSAAGTALPADYTFTAGDNGVHTFTAGVALVTAGPQSVAAADTVTTSISGSANVAVSAAPATHFTLSAPPTALPGIAFSVSVAALDLYNNVSPGYRGTVRFTKSDSGTASAVPANYSFTAADSGVHTFNNGVTLVTAGLQSITTTDTATSSIIGTQNINVASYSWSDFLSPLPKQVFATGSTIPIKFRLTGGSAGIKTLVAKGYWAPVNNGVVGTDTLIGTFKYDPATANYVLNWSTKPKTTGMFQIKADLGDGVLHIVVVTLK